MTKILVFTDLHIRVAGETPGGPDPLERFAAGLAQALARHPDAARLVIAGDLAHNGRAEEYARLAPVLDGLALPVTLMLGNHDARLPFRAAFPAAPVTAAGHVQAVTDIGDLRLVSLDTLDDRPARALPDAGWLCPDRLAWLEAALVGAGGRRVLVFAHHPPCPVGMPRMDAIRLANGDALLDRLRAAGNVAHLFCGHVHRRVSGVAGGIAFSTFESPGERLPLLLDPGAPLRAEAAPGAYGVILAPPGTIAAHAEEIAGG